MKATHNLIIYFSHSGNTKKISEHIKKEIGGDLLEIEATVPYPIVFQAAVDEMSRQNKGKVFPDFKQVNIDLERYDRIFLGYPVWDSRLPPVVRTFLRDHNFSGHTMIPFNTHKGFGTGKSVNEIKEFAKRAKVKDALSINEKDIESAASIVKMWLKEVNK